jgi:hypothetical protein
MTQRSGLGGVLPEGVTDARVQRAADGTLHAVVSLAGEARPSARTDIVFVLDVSATNRAALESGRMAETVWRVLEYVHQFDDDGVDFFLASTLLPSGDAVDAVVDALGEGRAPTEAELAAAHGFLSAGQASTRAQVEAMLDLDGGTIGLAGVLAPALRAARSKLKPGGRLFVQVVTDGQIVDREAVVAEIADMSRQCGQSENKAMYRLHLLGLGDVNQELFEHLDSGLDAVAPIDIVASDDASAMADGAACVFKEMRRSYLSVADNAIVTVRGVGLTSVTARGEHGTPDDYESGEFMLSLEQVPPELAFEFGFENTPSPVTVSLQLFTEEGERSCSLVLPLPD